MRRVAVTGAGGFVGRHLLPALRAAGAETVAVGRDAAALGRLGPEVEIRLVRGYDAEALKAAFAGCDVAIHLAGRRTTRDDDPDLSAPFVCDATALMEATMRAAAAAEVGRVVAMSSIGVYSTADPAPWTEDGPARPATPYGLAKLLAERTGDYWARRTGIALAHVRLAQCYGPGEKETPALMRMAGQALRGEPLRLARGGGFRIDQIAVADAVDGLLALARSDLCGPVNLGGGRDVSVLEIARTIDAVFEGGGRIEVEPAPADAPPEPLRHMAVDRARAALGWAPRRSLAEGLAALRAGAAFAKE